jgi:hypothetical protein
LKNVEAINHNKLKENSGSCWSDYTDKCGYPEKKTDTRNYNIVASVILNCATQKTKCTNNLSNKMSTDNSPPLGRDIMSL